MVRLFFLFFFSLVSSISYAQDVSVEATINQNLGIVDQPLNGTVTVTHPKKMGVDLQSFRLKQQPLPVTLNKEVTISTGENGLIISIYDFQLDSQPKGLYTLDPISVKVGHKTYQSIPTSYEVQGLRVSSPFSNNQLSKTPLIFRLEASVIGPSSLYPGQRAQLFYRIAYNRSVDLTYSDLPFLHTQDLIKVGDEQIKDYETNHVTYQEIMQEVEASKPGAYHYGPSVIEGYAYQINQLGQKIYESNKIRAEAPIITLTVKPFPIENQPLSFVGTIGPIEGTLKLLSPSNVEMGENIQLQLALTGPKHLADLNLPALLCQPGFSGFFEFNQSPSVVSVKDGVKTFQIELRPISIFAQEIPSIEISSFDPDTAHYISWRSQPIAIQVKSSPLASSSEQQAPYQMSARPVFARWQDPSITPALIPLPLLKEQQNSAHSHSFSLYKILAFILLGIGIIALQKFLFNKWKISFLSHRPPLSELLLKKALRLPPDSSSMPNLLKQAFLQCLQEQQIISVDDVSSREKGKEISEFIQEIEAMQYGSSKKSAAILQQKAVTLFTTLNN